MSKAPAIRSKQHLSPAVREFEERLLKGLYRKSCSKSLAVPALEDARMDTAASPRGFHSNEQVEGPESRPCVIAQMCAFVEEPA